MLKPSIGGLYKSGMATNASVAPGAFAKTSTQYFYP